MPLSSVQKRRLGVLVISSFLLALSGLYESHSYPFFLRWLYWATLVAIGIWLNDALARQLDPLTKSFPWLVRWLVRATALTMPLFAFVTTIQGFSDNPVPSGYYIDVAVKVWLVTAVLTAFGMRETETDDGTEPAERSSQTGPETAEEALLVPAALMSRLKPELKDANLIALAAEDHYVRVITDAGEELILLRFSDSLLETSPIEGLQVHRSWWVAKACIEELETSQSKKFIKLTNGVKAPLSRRREADLRKTGWL